MKSRKFETSQNNFTVFLIQFLGKVLNNTELGAVDFATLQETTVQKVSKYIKWTNENRCAVGKYASEHGNVEAVCHFKKDFPNNSKKKFEKQYSKKVLQKDRTTVAFGKI